MKKLFKAIRQNNLDEVKAILAKNPEAISSIAAPPPKKDIGQSPLQVAVKIEAFDIAYYLRWESIQTAATNSCLSFK